MNRVIWLAPGVAKCTAQVCHAGPCARRDISSDGRPQLDMSVGVWGNAPACMKPHYLKRILPSQAVKPIPDRPAKGWIGS